MHQLNYAKLKLKLNRNLNLNYTKLFVSIYILTRSIFSKYYRFMKRRNKKKIMEMDVDEDEEYGDTQATCETHFWGNISKNHLQIEF